MYERGGAFSFFQRSLNMVQVSKNCPRHARYNELIVKLELSILTKNL